jgi:lysophospholipase L1-like esterase
MKTVLLYGDSNTWGYVPGSDGERFATRWPVQLQELLGDEWQVIAEGLNGRTATIERPDSEGRNGLPYLLPCLHTHVPDVLVIFLGTNDAYLLEEELVARCVGRLVREARSAAVPGVFPEPRILVVCPPPFDDFRLGPPFAEVCAMLDCELLDLDGVTRYACVGDDTCHLDADGHTAVAAAVARALA